MLSNQLPSFSSFVCFHNEITSAFSHPNFLKLKNELYLLQLCDTNPANLLTLLRPRALYTVPSLSRVAPNQAGHLSSAPYFITSASLGDPRCLEKDCRCAGGCLLHHVNSRSARVGYRRQTQTRTPLLLVRKESVSWYWISTKI